MESCQPIKRLKDKEEEEKEEEEENKKKKKGQIFIRNIQMQK
jgi:hypothetical protein